MNSIEVEPMFFTMHKHAFASSLSNGHDSNYTAFGDYNAFSFLFFYRNGVCHNLVNPKHTWLVLIFDELISIPRWTYNSPYLWIMYFEPNIRWDFQMWKVRISVTTFCTVSQFICNFLTITVVIIIVSFQAYIFQIPINNLYVMNIWH